MLSEYTKVKNCTDIADLQGGIQDIQDAIALYKQTGKKIPGYFYSRLAKLKNKLKVLQFRALPTFSVTIRFKVDMNTLEKAVRHCIYYNEPITYEHICKVLKNKIIENGTSIIDFPEFWGDDLLTVNKDVVDRAISSLKLNFGL